MVSPSVHSTSSREYRQTASCQLNQSIGCPALFKRNICTYSLPLWQRRAHRATSSRIANNQILTISQQQKSITSQTEIGDRELPHYRHDRGCFSTTRTPR